MPREGFSDRLVIAAAKQSAGDPEGIAFGRQVADYVFENAFVPLR